MQFVIEKADGEHGTYYVVIAHYRCDDYMCECGQDPRKCPNEDEWGMWETVREISDSESDAALVVRTAAIDAAKKLGIPYYDA